VGHFIQYSDIRQVGNEFGHANHNLKLVGEGIKRLWDIQKLFGEFGEFLEVSLNLIVVLGYISVELEVLLLHRGSLLLWLSM
jgi:hypothetical protein